MHSVQVVVARDGWPERQSARTSQHYLVEVRMSLGLNDWRAAASGGRIGGMGAEWRFERNSRWFSGLSRVVNAGSSTPEKWAAMEERSNALALGHVRSHAR